MGKRKKVRKMRGSHTHGYGAKKKHRGGGSRGGRGKAGKFKQKKTWFLAHQPDAFGKERFKSKRKKYKAINIGDIDKKINLWLKQKKITEESGKIKIDLRKLGFGKVLGSGKITRPIIIMASSVTEKAKNKIESAKGEVVITK